jgi:hypothetical protein
MIVGISLPPELELTDAELGELLEEALNLQARANARWFARYPDAPCCLDCGSVKYREPPRRRRQDFPAAPQVLGAHSVGCAGAAAYEAGKALSKGTAARVAVELLGPGDYHAVVLYPDGRRSDPARELERG